MGTKLSHVFGVQFAVLLALCCFNFLLTLDTSSQSDCCPPPPFHPMTPRFPQGAQVNVYIVTTGFRTEEINAITTGLTDWNNQRNNTGVKFNVTTGTNPPTFPPATHTIVVSYVDEQNPNAIMDVQPFSSGSTVYFNMRAFQNIRNGWNQDVREQLTRTSARHEGGHTMGLAKRR